ncbi:winged helix-turn-helix transcriptional regulator [Rhizobiales bacterium]|uniref:MarR family winged helix-turn-helix transcriptional regulator n=1 Tax=Hongsoonwoonella zoysiae TaxID=2821844 RepID=UPI001560207A|nr:MarR family winged helix-turn-helix transcriptional regulator [Hongsoonwoonella zoysiae]NRG18978.1 winged helix-turn-helix transcriptional regulator [Hongsoonwoonella zoysiae]
MGRNKAQAADQISLFDSEVAFSENYLPFRVLHAARLVERRIAKALSEEFDLSLAEWMVLRALLDADCVSVRDLVPLTGLDTVAISRAATRLSDRRFLKKIINKQDRRLVVLTPSKAGRTLACEVDRKLSDLETAFLKGLGVQERVRLGQLLGAIIDSA